MSSAARPMTRAQQRAATRLAILEATVHCLNEDGYGGLSTRRIAERVGIAQSTVMHHFPTREALLADSVTHLAMRMADHALDVVNLTDLRTPELREAVLDQAWTEFTSPPALAAAAMWAAAWADPELAATLRDTEERLTTIVVGAAEAILPDLVANARFGSVFDATIALIRGLVLAIPIAGRAAVDRRWEEIKPLILEAAAHLLDGEPRP